MSWDDIKERESKFLKIPAGKSARVHLLGEPDEKVVHYIEKEKKYAPCADADCKLCEQSIERIDRFTVKVFEMEKKIAQIFEGPVSIILDMRKVRALYNNNIDGLDFMISRSDGTPAKYTVIPVPTIFKSEMLTVPF